MDGRSQSGILPDLSTEGALASGVAGSSCPADLRVLDGAGPAAEIGHSVE
jgi:hypothetical protein